MNKTMTRPMIVGALFALVLLPATLTGQQRRGESETLQLTANRVSTVKMNDDAISRVKSEDGLSSVLTVTRNGEVRARRGYTLYQAGERLVVRNNAGPMASTMRVEFTNTSSGPSIVTSWCGCSNKDNDECIWMQNEDGTETCGGEVDGCCTTRVREIGIFWYEE